MELEGKGPPGDSARARGRALTAALAPVPLYRPAARRPVTEGRGCQAASPGARSGSWYAVHPADPSRHGLPKVTSNLGPAPKASIAPSPMTAPSPVMCIPGLPRLTPGV